MAFSKSFERELNSLFRQRTDWLRRKVGTATMGKPPNFSRKKVGAGIGKSTRTRVERLRRKTSEARVQRTRCLAGRTTTSKVGDLTTKRQSSKSGFPIVSGSPRG